jgi:tetratricopeptide (TPR) repeat protein
MRAFYLFLMGRTDNSLSNIQMAADLAENLMRPADRASAVWLRAWIHYSLGNFEQAQKDDDGSYSALAQANPSIDPFSKIRHCFLDGLIALEQKQFGRLTSALKEIASLSSDSYVATWGFMMERTRFEREWLRAMAALQETSPDENSGVLNNAETVGRIPHSGYVDMYPWIRYNTPFQRDALARKYAERGDTDRAIAQYERLITFDPKSPSRVLIHPLYHYRLAKLYDQKGLKDKAKAQLERFLDLWKDADPGRPEVEDAKARLKALL